MKHTMFYPSSNLSASYEKKVPPGPKLQIYLYYTTFFLNLYLILARNIVVVTSLILELVKEEKYISNIGTEGVGFFRLSNCSKYISKLDHSTSPQ